MRFLLDTHIWLWQALEPGRLRPRLRAVLQEPGHEFWLSPVSVWELSTLCAKRRFRIESGMELGAWVRESMRRSELREAPLTLEAALASDSLSWVHQDPGDRLLAATAQVMGLVLVTADERLLGVPGLAVLANA